MATFIRVFLIGIRIVFEFIVERVNRSTICLLMASSSFIYSGHIMPLHEEFWLIVMIVDLSLLLAILIFAGSIKIFAKRHNITIACRKAFIKIAIASCIFYALFITAMSFINHIQRSIFKIEFTSSLFYSEAVILIYYITLFGIKKL